MRVLHDVVKTLLSGRVTAQTVGLSQLIEPGQPPCQHLVDIRLVSGIEDNRIGRGCEHAMQCDRQFDNTEIGTQMPAGAGHLLDKEHPDFRGKFAKLCRRQSRQIGGFTDRREDGHPKILGRRESRSLRQASMNGFSLA